MFEDRLEAGILLGQKLRKFKKKSGVLILGIPRGGVITAMSVAKELDLPLDVVIARKVGAPAQQELAIGAVSEGESFILDNELIKRLGVEKNYIEKAISNKKNEIRKRVKKFRGSKNLNLRLKTVILVDDGIATGATIAAAVKFLRNAKVKKIILGVPVAPRETIDQLSKLVDEAIVLSTPSDFRAVGQFYRNFPQVTDEEVMELIGQGTNRALF